MVWLLTLNLPMTNSNHLKTSSSEVPTRKIWYLWTLRLFWADPGAYLCLHGWMALSLDYMRPAQHVLSVQNPGSKVWYISHTGLCGQDHPSWYPAVKKWFTRTSSWLHYLPWIKAQDQKKSRSQMRLIYISKLLASKFFYLFISFIAA